MIEVNDGLSEIRRGRGGLPSSRATVEQALGKLACAPLLVGTAPVCEPIAESLEVRSGQWGEEGVLRSLQVESTPAGLALHPGGDSTGLATRTLDLPAATRFVALQLCFGARDRQQNATCRRARGAARASLVRTLRK